MMQARRKTMIGGFGTATLFMALGTIGVSGAIGAPSARGVGSWIEEASGEQDRCSYEDIREMSASAANVRRLGVEAGSGELRVEGRPELDEIRVEARVCASSQELLDELQVTLDESRGGALTVVTHYPDRDGWRGGGRTARIDLTVVMPRGLAVDIDDSSGEMTVSGTGALRIDDSSGSIRVTEVSGDVRIDDTSGDLDVRDVVGDVEIDDGSGGLTVLDIEGDLRLRDGSGGIEVSGVDGSVLVDADGSGSIDVADVAGDFTVARDGSGSIRHRGVEGRVDIPARRRRGGE